VGYWDFTRGSGTVVHNPFPTGAWQNIGENAYLSNGAVWDRGPALGVGVRTDQGGSHPGIDLSNVGAGIQTPNPLRLQKFTIQVIAEQADTNAKKLLGISPAGEGSGVTIQWVPAPFQTPEGLRFHVEGNTVEIPWSKYGDKKYHVFTITYNGSTIRAHADLLVGTTSWTGTVSWGNVVTLGNLSQDVGANQPWTGPIYSMRWWNRVLTQSEIRELWASPWAFLATPAYTLGAAITVPQILPTSLGSATGFGSTTLIKVRIIELASLDSAVGFGTPTLLPAFVTESLGSPAMFGTPTIRFAGRFDPVPLDSATRFGRLALASLTQPLPYSIPVSESLETCRGILTKVPCNPRGGYLMPLSLRPTRVWGTPTLVGV